MQLCETKLFGVRPSRRARINLSFYDLRKKMKPRQICDFIFGCRISLFFFRFSFVGRHIFYLLLKVLVGNITHISRVKDSKIHACFMNYLLGRNHD